MTNLYQLKIQLKNITPTIFRTVVVPESITFDELHQTIQLAMGWCNYHLYQFIIDRHNYILIPNEEFDFGNTYNAKKYKISDYFSTIKKSIVYEYDFGDGWQHTVTLQKIILNTNNTKKAICIKGARSCPPEDCGGPWGYQNLLKILASKKGEEYEEMIEWIDEDFDSEYFDIDEVNADLSSLKFKVKP
jgi:hypothetical protein